MAQTALAIRLRLPLPQIVHGGLTSWEVYAVRFDKSGKRIGYYARCLQDGRVLTLKETLHHRDTGTLHAAAGTLPYKILRRMIRDGQAEPAS